MQEGDSITGQNGAYRLRRRLGQPGLFGEAFLADTLDASTVVASTVVVKALRSEAGNAASAEARERFGREANTLKQVEKAHNGAPLYVIRLLDQSTPDAATPFLVLEQATGRNVLHDMVEPVVDWKHAPPPTRELLTIATHLIEALIIVHKAGICYDDMKLDNLFWDPNRSPPLKIIDWNVTSDLAQRGESGDWARFGARLLEMLTGYRLGLDRDAQIIAGSPQLAPGWSRMSLGLQQIITRALHPNLSQRYQDGATVRDDLAIEIEASSLSLDTLVSQTRQALGQRRYDQARIWIDHALRAAPESIELRQLLDAVERGRGRARQDWIDVGIRLLQRQEFTDAADRFSTAYHENGRIDGHARRLLWTTEICRRTLGGYSVVGEQILSAINTIAGDLDSLDLSATAQAMLTLDALARQYPQQAELGWLAAEACLIDSLARLYVTDVTEVEVREGYLKLADTALGKLSVTNVVDLARRRDEVAEHRRLIEDQRTRQNLIIALREALSRAIQAAEQVLVSDDDRGLSATIEELHRAAQRLQAQTPDPDRQDMALIERATFLNNAAPLRGQIAELREQLQSTALDQRSAVLRPYERWRANISQESYTLFQRQLDQLDQLAKDTQQAMTLYADWLHTSGPKEGYGILCELLRLNVHYGPGNKDIRQLKNSTVQLASTPVDPAVEVQLRQQVQTALDESLEQLDEQPLQEAEQQLSQTTAFGDPAYSRLIDDLRAQIEQRRLGLRVAVVVIPRLRSWKEADRPHDVADAAQRLRDLHQLRDQLQRVPIWAEGWQQDFDALFQPQITNLRSRASTDSVHNPDDLTKLRTEVQQLRTHVGDIPDALPPIEEITNAIDALSAQLVVKERVRSLIDTAQDLLIEGYVDAADRAIRRIIVDQIPEVFIAEIEQLKDAIRTKKIKSHLIDSQQPVVKLDDPPLLILSPQTNWSVTEDLQTQIDHREREAAETARAAARYQANNLNDALCYWRKAKRLHPEGKYQGSSYELHYIRTQQQVVAALESLASAMRGFIGPWDKEPTLQLWRDENTSVLTLQIIKELTDLNSDWLKFYVDIYGSSQTAPDMVLFAKRIEQTLHTLRTKSERLMANLQQHEEKWLEPHILRLFTGSQGIEAEPVITSYDKQLSPFATLGHIL